jgi:hypothetical protein
MLVQVKPVTDDEDVRHRKTAVVDGDFYFPARGFVEEGADPAGEGAPSLHPLEKIAGSAAGVDDVVHDENVAAANRHLDVLGEAEPSGPCPAAVTREAHEIHGHGSFQEADQVGKEDEGALQNAHDGERLTSAVTVDLSGETPDGVPYGSRIEERGKGDTFHDGLDTIGLP